MLLGGLVYETQGGRRQQRIIYPLALGAASIISSYLGTFFVKVGEGGKS